MSHALSVHQESHKYSAVHSLYMPLVLWVTLDGADCCRALVVYQNWVDSSHRYFEAQLRGPIALVLTARVVLRHRQAV